MGYEHARSGVIEVLRIRCCLNFNRNVVIGSGTKIIFLTSSIDLSGLETSDSIDHIKVIWLGNYPNIIGNYFLIYPITYRISGPRRKDINMNIFFTSDHHFDHFNAIRHSKRPFTTVEEMNETLYDRWNEVVQPNDTVYHLGDLCWRKQNLIKVFSRLNGKIHMILGNHDEKNKNKILLHVESMDRLIMIKIDGHDLTLCHYPIASWPSKSHGSIHLHGHCHGNMANDINFMDVGVDTNKFYPYSWEDVKKKIDSIKEMI
jgi:calcineurin-like phosphoesterase family protein